MAETSTSDTSGRFRAANLFANVPNAGSTEVTEILVDGSHARIERIVSHGQASPPGFWYDQEWDEWVAVLKGRAKLRFQDRSGEVELRLGDWMNIPAHARHRVEWTDPDQDTVWLVLHYS